jgi:putative glutamine amidotransferase
MPRPLIGITADANAEKYLVGRAYAAMVTQAGGAPLILPCIRECVADYLRIADGIILTGGDDPVTTHWGIPMHPKATPVDPERQVFELALLEALKPLREKPVLGVCLGMQMMGLHAGGTLDQHLPDTLPTADLHWNKCNHEIIGELGGGAVHSHHRQALTDPGRHMKVIATSPDGVIEAIRHDDRPFYLGVQWHPERTSDAQLGLGLIQKLIDAARRK